MNKAADSPIFVVGTGRSGTTLVNRMLGNHPNIHAIHWESQFLVSKGGLLDFFDERLYFRKKKLFGAFIQQMRGRWYKRTIRKKTGNQYEAGLFVDVSERRLVEFQDSLRRFLDEPLLWDDRECKASMINNLFSDSLICSGATRWSEKTPASLINMDRIHKIFPSAKFLHVVRDGRDVCNSMLKNQFWPIAGGLRELRFERYTGPVTLEAACDYWTDYLAEANRLATELPFGAYFEFRYEDLINEPHKTLRNIFKFLGEADGAKDALSGLKLRTESIGKSSQLNQRDIDFMTARMKDTLKKFGYI